MLNFMSLVYTIVNQSFSRQVRTPFDVLSVLIWTQTVCKGSGRQTWSLSGKELNEACTIITPDKQQSKTLLKIDERGSKIVRNSVFDYK